MQTFQEQIRFYKILSFILGILFTISLLMIINVTLSTNKFEEKYSDKIDTLEKQVITLSEKKTDTVIIYKELNIGNLNLKKELNQMKNMVNDLRKEQFAYEQSLRLQKLQITPDREISYDINTVSGLTSSEYDIIIQVVLKEHHIQNSRLLWCGEKIYLIEKELHINGLFILSVAARSSEYGTSVEAWQNNNLFRLSSSASKYVSLYDSIINFTALIKVYYIEEGYLTIDDISKKYAPLNSKEWANTVTTIMYEYKDQVQKMIDSENKITE